MSSIQQMTEDVKNLEWNLGVKYFDTDSMVLSLFSIFKDESPYLFRSILDRFIDQNLEQLPTLEDFKSEIRNALDLSEKMRSEKKDDNISGDLAEAEDWKIFMENMRSHSKKNDGESKIEIGKKIDQEVKRAIQRRKDHNFKYQEYEGA